MSSSDRTVRLAAQIDTAPGQAPASKDSLQATLITALTQLYGLVGGAVSFTVEEGTAAEGGGLVVTLEPRDEQKVQTAAAFVTQHTGAPARLQLRRLED